MPGLNQNGPDGSGPRSGRQQGMCRRTDELSLKGRRDGQGRGMGGRCRGSFFDEPGANQQTRVETFGSASKEAEELSTLKAEYKKAQEMLQSLMEEIAVLEKDTGSKQKSGSEDKA